MAAGPKDIAIACGDMTLSALRWGPETGEPVLALHGWLDNAATFHRLAPLLPDHWQILALDLPGHGLSPHRGPGSTYPFFEWVCDLRRVLDELGWQQPRLLGHSMGAGICSLFAGTFPDRFRDIIAIEGIAPLTAEPSEAPERLAAYVEAALGEGRRPKARYATIEEALQVRAKAGDFEDLSALTPVVERNLKHVDGRFVWRTDSRLRSRAAVRMTREQVAAFLARISKPMLVVRADQGLDIAGETMKHLHGLLPQLQVAEVKGFHHLHLDHPDRVASAIDQWLQSSETPKNK